MTAITGISTYRSPSFPTRRSPELAVDRQHHQHALAAGVGQARGVAVAGNAGQPAITAVAVLRQPAAVVAVDDGNFHLRIRGGWEAGEGGEQRRARSEEHTSELQSLMRISYAVFCLKKKKKTNKNQSKLQQSA